MPKKEILNEINKNMYEFIWNSKTDKISRKTIVQDIEYGGLKMINIELFMNAIKASWVKRLLDNNNKGIWKEKYQALLNKVGGFFFFQCNCKYVHAKKVIPHDDFLADVIESWCKIHYAEPIDLFNEILWNNTEIKHQNKIIYSNYLHNVGIKRIKHIFNTDEKRFYTFNELKNLYGLDNSQFLQYHRIINSIPHDWKTTFEEENIDEQNENNILINKIMRVKKVCSFLYKIQLDKIKTDIKAHNKWEQILETNINWKVVHTLPFKCTIDTKLRVFQYKFIMRIIATNKFLFRCKISASNLCDFCNMHIESQMHLFYYCPIVQRFWGLFKEYIEQKHLHFELTLKNVCLGLYDDNILVNYLVVLAKKYIYNSKLQSKIPNIEAFKNIVLFNEKIERIVALKNEKLEKHNRKWSNFLLDN